MTPSRTSRWRRDTLVSPAYRRAVHRSQRWVHRHLPGEREMPSYFIVGTKRGGTTSLNEYLVQHPDVVRGLVEKGCRYFDVHFDKGWAWFCGNFPTKRAIDRREATSGTRPIVGESSPYYCYHPAAAQRIADRFPDARLIFCIREPVARAWSHYQYEVSRGFESLSFGDALDAEQERLTTGTEDERQHAHRHFTYVARGRYAEQLEHLLRSFDREQILVVESERLFSSAADVMAEVYNHLGLRAYAGDYGRAFKQNEYAGLSASLRDRLVAEFAEPNERLRSMVGQVAWLG